MKIILANILTIAFLNSVYSQIPGFLEAKEFSKEISLFKSKEFLFQSVLGSSEQVTSFEVIPLAAASSGELTTLLYACESKKKEGLILGFYGLERNEFGQTYMGFSFKNIEKEKAIEFLNKIEKSIEENKKYLKENNDVNNIFFKFDDMDILIWGLESGFYSIRIFWNGFDSTWDKTSFDRSKSRFLKNLK